MRAVDGIYFDLAPGEVVGYLGPNGAGKTTTLKMLSGLLHPTAGTLSVPGYLPWKREKAFLRQITLVMGQRNQLVWDIPAADSFELNRAIYRIPAHDFRRTVNELTELLDLGPLVKKPVRNLSLGERMKCEIAAALLHRPQVVGEIACDEISHKAPSSAMCATPSPTMASHCRGARGAGLRPPPSPL